MPVDFSLLTSMPKQPGIALQPQPQPQQTMGGFPLFPPPPVSVAPLSQSSPFAAAFPNLTTSTTASSSITSPKIPQQQQQNIASSPGSAFQGFGLDVFGLGSASLTATTPPSAITQQGSPLLSAKFGTELQPGLGGIGMQQSSMGMGLQQPGGMGMGQPLQQPAMGMVLQQPPQMNGDPLAVLNDLFVSLDSIQPGKSRKYLLYIHVQVTCTCST